MSSSQSRVSVYRQDLTFAPMGNRVITRLFDFEETRINNIFNRVLKLSDKERAAILKDVITKFNGRHRNIQRILKDNFDEINDKLKTTEYNDISLEKKLIIGAYFTLEYSIESAALFNPSIVPHPFQNPKEIKSDELKVIISFRAVGEGHMSSVIFRSGILDKNGDLIMDPLSPLVQRAKIIRSVQYNKSDFKRKLQDMGSYDCVRGIFKELLDSFTNDELEESIRIFRKKNNLTKKQEEAIVLLHWIVRANYEIEFDDESDLSERVIFPRSKTDIRAIEDARFVYFENPDGSNIYYAPYTSFNGFSILPQLIETRDFYRFKISTMMGPGSQNKGIALFPEKINGKYAVISRNDNENLYIMYSDNLLYWENPILLRKPKYYWELVQIGNSGSPLKTDRGWLLLTHGVGPMRTYSIGAILLDLKNPEKIIAELKEPLLVPQESERDGYVPNVVYSCGGILHNQWLVLPYAASDTRSGVVKFKVSEIFEKMTPLKD